VIHLLHDIRKVVSDMFADNEYGIKFDVGLFNARHDQDFIDKTADKKSYNVALQRYIPVVIEDIVGEYEEVPHETLVEAELVSSILLYTDREIAPSGQGIEDVLLQWNTEHVYRVLDDIRKKYQAQMIPIGDVGWQLFDDAPITFEQDPDDQDLEQFVFEASFADRCAQDLVTFENSDVKISQEENIIRIHAGGVSTGFYYDLNKLYQIQLLDKNEVIVFDGDEEFEPSYPSGFSINDMRDFTIHPFCGLVHSVAGNFEYDEEMHFKQLLVEDFETLENVADLGEAPDPYTIETVEDKHAVRKMGTRGRLAFTFTFPSPSTNQFTLGREGLRYQVFDWPLSLTVVGPNAYTGNDFRYYLDGYEIFPSQRDHVYSAEADVAQIINAKTAKALIRDNVLGDTFTLVHQNKKNVRDFYKHVMTVEEQNKDFELKIEHPYFIEKRSVKVQEFGTSPTYNSTNAFSFEVVPSKIFD